MQDQSPSVGRPAARCGHRECYDGGREPLATLPNLITASRTVLSLLLVALALRWRSEDLVLWGVAVYWLGDIADGLVARDTGTETRTGAVLDILCDRLGCASCFLAYATFHPGMLPAVVVFLLQFMVVDNYLSLSFQRWPLSSPNYFYLVDPLVHRLNWSPVAKSLNSGALLLLMVVTDDVLLATGFALAVGAVKVWSLLRVVALPSSSAACARPGAVSAAAVELPA